jgi:hypothetical protein
MVPVWVLSVIYIVNNVGIILESVKSNYYNTEVQRSVNRKTRYQDKIIYAMGQ